MTATKIAREVDGVVRIVMVNNADAGRQVNVYVYVTKVLRNPTSMVVFGWVAGRLFALIALLQSMPLLSTFLSSLFIY